MPSPRGSCLGRPTQSCEFALSFEHTLATHIFLAPQAMPQPPQLALSFVVSMHMPEQRVKPASHAVPQPLLVQVAVPWPVPGHFLPHAPQLLMSLVVSKHALPQRIRGRVHWKLHVPLQTGMAFGGAMHAVPHFPQLEVSEARFTHEPPQLVWVPQSAVHTPALHTVPALQTVLQPPQCFESDCRSMHAFPHTVYPELHLAPQAEAVHTAEPLAGIGHTVPHFPQLAMSVPS
jgi:hypothetical protein